MNTPGLLPSPDQRTEQPTVADTGRSRIGTLYPEQYELHPARPHLVPLGPDVDFVKTFTGGLAVLWLLDPTEARGQAESGGAGAEGPRWKSAAG